MNNYALITGATSGIGEQFANLLALEKYNLFLTGRREDKLKALKKELENKYGINVDYYALDLNEDKAAIKLYDEIKSREIEIDYLINNAGFGQYGPFGEEDLEIDLKMINLNNTVLVSLTYLFLKDMKKNKHGAILNVGSIASFFPGPYMSLYYATKAFVLSFSRALKEEVKDDGIVVSCLCPGPLKTSFAKVAGASDTLIFGKNNEDKVRKTAAYGLNLVKKQRAFVLYGLNNNLAVFVMHLIPSPFDTKIIKRVQSLKKN